jgi:hypothetical protein
MRPRSEIQQAHDVLVQQLLGEIPQAFDNDDEELVNTAAGVLCWVLRHEHNPAFKTTLERMNEHLRDLGYVTYRLNAPEVRRGG